MKIFAAGKGYTHKIGGGLRACRPIDAKEILRFFPDVERPKYADETEEAKLERMLKEALRAKG
jgi:hypothetical protein